MRPFLSRGENHGPGTGNDPIPRLGQDFAGVMAAPAMIKNIEAESWGRIQIGFEGKSLFLFAPAADQPLHGQSAGHKVYREPRIFKKAGRKVKAGLYQ